MAVFGKVLVAAALMVASGVRSSCDTDDNNAVFSRSLSSATWARATDRAKRDTDAFGDVVQDETDDQEGA